LSGGYNVACPCPVSVLTDKQKILTGSDMLRNCRLCPRHCRVDRTKGETGRCGLGPDIRIEHMLAHHGEEPPISGIHGAGTIFLSSCNLRCLYCQNHQISHQAGGKRITPGKLGDAMLALQVQGCHNIEFVTPTPQLPRLIESLAEARSRGLTIPLVYNCGGYEDPEIVRLLENTVDIYMPDFKYGRSDLAATLSGAGDYVQYALSSIREMVRQVGDGLSEDHGIARKGIIIRHLVLPGMVENSLAVLALIKEHISVQVPISVMAQYTPMEAMQDHPQLGRRITRDEYDCVVDYACDLGFETIFCQDVDNRHMAPDFGREMPFG
jgi:putative pyruvate formate lyase activating enzyme